MVHYHGCPITPRSVLDSLAGANFCVSYASRGDVERVHQIGQSVMLDNGAFTFWKQGIQTDWPGYYEWCERWLQYQTTWAVIPDVIEGSENENDALIEEWPFGMRGAPVWHMHESIARLLRLCGDWPRVCIGSSAEYSEVGDVRWHERMRFVMRWLCGDGGSAPTWLHMLRGMKLCGSEYPFASADSTNVGRNHNSARASRSLNALLMVGRIDAVQCPGTWTDRQNGKN